MFCTSAVNSALRVPIWHTNPYNHQYCFVFFFLFCCGEQGLDTDGDGSIDLEEFLSVMEPIVTQMEEEETQEMISSRIWDVLDEDGEGEIEISEFRNVLQKVGLSMSYDEVRELFSEFDEDGSCP